MFNFFRCVFIDACSCRNPTNMLLTCTLKTQQLVKHAKLGSTRNYALCETNLVSHETSVWTVLYEKFVPYETNALFRAKLFNLREIKSVLSIIFKIIVLTFTTVFWLLFQLSTFKYMATGFKRLENSILNIVAIRNNIQTFPNNNLKFYSNCYLNSRNSAC